MSWFARLFGIKRKTKVPILGIEGSGKTCLAWGIGHFLSEQGWGTPSNNASEYFSQIDSYMLKGEPIPSSLGKQALEFEIQKIDIGEGHDKPWTLPDGGLILSTYDISGGDFREAMEVYSSADPNPQRNKGVQQFSSLVVNSAGLIVVVDLARRITDKETFDSLSPEDQGEHMLNSLGEQVTALSRGIIRTLEANPSDEERHVFFVFTKSDIHQRDAGQVQNMLNTAYAIIRRRLESHGIRTHSFAVSYSPARQMLADGRVEYELKGVGEFITEMTRLLVFGKRQEETE